MSIPFQSSLLAMSQGFPAGRINRPPFKSYSKALNAVFDIYEYLKGVTVARQFVNKHYYSFVSCPAHKQFIEVGGSKSLHDKLGLSDNIRALDIVLSNDIDICEDVENLSFSDQSIDRFICISVLEHVEDPGRAISEMLRCLKPGGQIILSVPWMFEMHMEPRDYHRYTSEGIKLISANAQIINIIYSNGYLGLLAHFLQRSITLRYLLGWFFYSLSLFEKPSERFASQFHLILEKPLQPIQNGKP